MRPRSSVAEPAGQHEQQPGEREGEHERDQQADAWSTAGDDHGVNVTTATGSAVTL